MWIVDVDNYCVESGFLKCVVWKSNMWIPKMWNVEIHSVETCLMWSVEWWNSTSWNVEYNSVRKMCRV